MPHMPFPASRPGAIALGLATAVLCTGCATTATTATPGDPLEPVNRKVFAFNDGLDRAVFKPTATAYRKVVPAPVQTGVSNFFANLQAPWSSANLLLQGRARDSASTVARFGVNSTVGLLGVLDVASGWGLPARASEDFGLTLGTWGVGSGPFVVLPLLGPSNLRDALAIPVDSLGNPKGSIEDVAVRNSLTALQIVNKRAELLEVTRLLDQAALDKYAMVRDGHQKRRNRTAQPPGVQPGTPGAIPPEGAATGPGEPTVD